MVLLQSPVLFKHRNESVYLFTLKNNQGIEVSISNLGAIIQSLIVPGKTGEVCDIVLGFDDMSQYLSPDYLNANAYLGATVGRYANRIKSSCFELDGELVQLSSNFSAHQLHGGFEGFDRKVWKVEQISESPETKIVFSYLSEDGEEGFPGNLRVRVSFELTDSNELIIETKASTDKPTAVNLTHHDYFNLNGKGRIEDHFVEIPASFYLGQDPDMVPTGEFISVEGSGYDFRKVTQISRVWNSENGYDQSFILDKKYTEWGKAAMVLSEKTGIKLEIYTDEPSVQFYTGKHLNIKSAKRGENYLPFTGLCFETQHHTNAVNIPAFPSTILRPGELYRHKSSFVLSVI